MVFTSAVLDAIDAPRSVEMAQSVKRIFRLALLVYNLGGDLRRLQAALQDVRVILDLAGASGEGKSLRSTTT